MRAMILSAGYGTRLWPLTEDRTKPALPILGKPLVGYVAEYLANFGCREIVVNLHHRPESVVAALGDGSRFGVALTYVEEPTILGTSGALDNARPLLDKETFIVVNGKIITDSDLNAALETHRKTNALVTLVLLPNVARERFSTVETAGRFVRGFGGMPPALSGTADFRLGQDAPLMFTGIQILEPRIFDYIPRGAFSHSTADVYPKAIAQGERIAAHVGEGLWYELSTLQRYLDISLALLKAQGRNVDLGRNCLVDEAAQVRDSVLWNDVSVAEGARVQRAVIGDGVQIPARQLVENQVVVRADLVASRVRPAKALPGRVEGDNFVVRLSQ